MVRVVVLGRFQPFHRGHAHLLEAALVVAEDDELVVAIGSSEAEATLRNPWSAPEREAMLRSWLAEVHPEAGERVRVCHVPDINDPPAWVAHATSFHGTGLLVTSDEPTALLYEADGWSVHRVDLHGRSDWEGWRVRETARMLSTVGDDEAVLTVLEPSVPSSVVRWLIAEDALYRLSLLREGPVVG